MRAFCLLSLFQTSLVWHVLVDRADTEANLWLHNPPFPLTATNGPCVMRWHVLINVPQPNLNLLQWTESRILHLMCSGLLPGPSCLDLHTNLAFFLKHNMHQSQGKIFQAWLLFTASCNSHPKAFSQGVGEAPPSHLGLGLSPGDCRQSLHTDTAPGQGSALNPDSKILNPSPQTQTSPKTAVISPPRVNKVGKDLRDHPVQPLSQGLMLCVGQRWCSGLRKTVLHTLRTSKAQFQP